MNQINLNLQNVPPVLYLFGLAGAGKNFVADLIGRFSTRHVYHADSDLTDEIQLAILEKRTFTPEMRDRYFKIVVDKILSLQKVHPLLVVTQATYRQRHRDFLVKKIPELGLVHISASDAVILQRLTNRGDLITPDFAKQMRLQFEFPLADSKTIVNDSDDIAVINQLNVLFK